jgi:hypothetical protein
VQSMKQKPRVIPTDKFKCVLDKLRPASPGGKFYLAICCKCGVEFRGDGCDLELSKHLETQEYLCQTMNEPKP